MARLTDTMLLMSIFGTSLVVPLVMALNEFMNQVVAGTQLLFRGPFRTGTLLEEERGWVGRSYTNL